jgi:HK97 family phage major capsid protein
MDNNIEKAKNLIREVNKEFANEYVPRLEAIEKAAAKNESVAELAHTISKMDENLNRLQRELDEANAVIKASSFTHGSDKEDRLEKSYNEVFLKQVRGARLSDSELALAAEYTKAFASSGGTGTNGGLTVPKGYADMIQAQVERKVPHIGMADFRTVSTGESQWLIQSTVSAAAVTNETTASANTTTASIPEVLIRAYDVSAEPWITRELLEDSAVDMETFLMNDISNAIADTFGDKLINGSGTGEPLGILTSGASAQTNIYNVIELDAAAPSGNTIPAGTFSLDDLYDVKYDLNPRYVVPGQMAWTLGNAAIKQMRKFKDNEGQYLWQPSHQIGQPALFDGDPVLYTPYMPALTANADIDVAVYGNFRLGLGVVKHALGDFILRDEYTNKKYVKFYMKQRWGAGVTDGRALRILRTASAGV